MADPLPVTGIWVGSGWATAGADGTAAGRLARAWRHLGAGLLACAIGLAGIAVASPEARAQATSGGEAPAAGGRDAAPPNFFVPADAFDAGGRLARPIEPEPAAAVPAATPAAPFKREVLVYLGAANRAFFSGGGLDAQAVARPWEQFLLKYRFPSRGIATAEDIESAAPSVLVLPSAVVLTARERQAVAGFRARGGSVLATWLSGVRDESGAWRGFGFMQSVLGAKVEGHTGPTEEQRFLNIHGDTAVTHYLPAGQRIWLERPGQWYPLQLSGGHSAARLVDWSRAVAHEVPDAALVFDERRPAGGPPSRAVVFGWPERLWLAADAQRMEAVLHNALTWALRQPSAYLAAWPHPYRSATAVNVFMADVFNDNDLPFAQRLQEAGLRATYYVLGFDLDKSAPTLKKLQARGHDLGYQGDRYEGFKGQPPATQAERLRRMQQDVAAQGLTLAPEPGFMAPMDEYDPTTVGLLMGLPVGHLIGTSSETDARLPYLPPVPSDVTRTGVPFVVLPRTQRSIEELTTDHDNDEVVRVVGAELGVADRAGALTLLRFPNQTLLSADSQQAIFKALKAKSDRMWLTRSAELADWARERARIGFDLGGDAKAPILTVTVAGEQALRFPAAAVLTLPMPGQRLAITSGRTVPVQAVDDWRAALVLKDLPPGTHRWELRFEGGGAIAGR